MTDLAARTIRPTPRFSAVFREQLRLTGHALRMETVITVVGVVCAVRLYEAFVDGGVTSLRPTDAALPAVIALLLPLAVWRGERLFDDPYLATLPVDRQLHILGRALAGAVWIVGTIAGALITMNVIDLLAGGDLGHDRHLLTGAAGPDGEVAAGAVRRIRWTPEAWNWIAMWSASLITYVLGTAFTIGVRHKVRWLAAAVAGLLALTLVVSLVAGGGSLAESLAEAVFAGPLGLGQVLEGGAGQLQTRVILPGQGQVSAWTGLPDMRLWLYASLLWLTVGSALFWLAAWRHRER